MLDFTVRNYPNPDIAETNGYANGTIGRHDWHVGWFRRQFCVRVRSLAHRADYVFVRDRDGTDFPSRGEIEGYVRLVHSGLPHFEQKVENLVAGLVSTVYAAEFNPAEEIRMVSGILSDYQYRILPLDKTFEVLGLEIKNRYSHSPIPQLIRAERLCRIQRIHDS